MNNSIVIPIENLRVWNGGNWLKYVLESFQLLLRIHYDQIFIISGDKILESQNTNGNIKGIYKDDVLILVINVNSQTVRKIKFQVKKNLLQCLRELSARFPVINYDSMTKNKTSSQSSKQYHDVKDILKNVVESKAQLNTIPMPSDFNNFVKLCLLDPTFPQFIAQVKEVLDKEILNKISL